jgi:hypothetical protein
VLSQVIRKFNRKLREKGIQKIYGSKPEMVI